MNIDKKRVPRSLDKRIKLSDEQKREIYKLYHFNGYGVRKIARLFEGVCSRRLIQFVLFPERKKVVAQQFKERRKDGRYYDKNKHREYMRKHRAHKRAYKDKLI